MTPLDAALAYLDAHRDQAVARLGDLLAIPSVSTDPARRGDVRAACLWCATQLQDLGLDVRIEETGDPTADPTADAGHPALIATAPPHLITNPDAPRVLFYGHYDVQPPDPLDLWTTPPFQPTLRNAAIYARGASDDKGQTLLFIEALRACLQTAGQLPCPVTLLIEGEEEIGSQHLPALVHAHRDTLAADVALISDTSMWDLPNRPPQPAVTYGLRGLVYFDIQLQGPSRDLHSGVYGGTLANPANLLTRILANLFDDQNRVTLPHFYDDVAAVTPEEHDAWQRLGFDESQFLNAVGVTQPFGEAGFSTLERRWARPSCDINGLYSGFTGQGAKTVLPRFAGAKVSFRIAPHQNTHTIADTFEDWLRSQDTGGCTWTITRHGEAEPSLMPTDSPYLQATRRAIQHITGEPPALIREGATIPIGADFKRILHIDTLFVGFGLNSDAIHSPDEHFALDRFHLGAKVHTAILHELARI